MKTYNIDIRVVNYDVEHDTANRNLLKNMKSDENHAENNPQIQCNFICNANTNNWTGMDPVPMSSSLQNFLAESNTINF